MSLDFGIDLSMLDGLVSLSKTINEEKKQGRKRKEKKNGWIVVFEAKASGFEIWFNQDFPTRGGRRLHSAMGLLPEHSARLIATEEATKRGCILIEEKNFQEVEEVYNHSPAGMDYTFLPSANADGKLQDYLSSLDNEQKRKLAIKIAQMWSKAYKHGFCGNRFAEWIAAIMKKRVTRNHVMFCSDILGWIEREYSNKEFNQECGLPEVFPRATFKIPKPNESYTPSLNWVQELMKPTT